MVGTSPDLKNLVLFHIVLSEKIFWICCIELIVKFKAQFQSILLFRRPEECIPCQDYIKDKSLLQKQNLGIAKGYYR